MCCNGLVGFNFEYNKNASSDASKQDMAESIGTFLSKPLILACGEEVKVTSDASGLTFLTEEKRNTIQRVVWGILAAALFPLTIIGLIASAYSTTHNATHKTYLKQMVKPVSNSIAIQTAPGAGEGKNSPAETTAKVDSLIKPGTNNKKPNASEATASATVSTVKPATAQPSAPPKITTPVVTETIAPADWVGKISQKYFVGEFEQEVGRLTGLWRFNHRDFDWHRIKQQLDGFNEEEMKQFKEWRNLQADGRKKLKEETTAEFTELNKIRNEPNPGQNPKWLLLGQTERKVKRIELLEKLYYAEMDMYEGRKKLDEDIKNLNENAFAYTKEKVQEFEKKQIETPRDILWGLQGRKIGKPIPISDCTTQLKEGVFHDITQMAWSYVNRELFQEMKDLTLLRKYISETCYAVKYEKGKVELFTTYNVMVGNAIMVNGRSLHSVEGVGPERPFYCFKEGDVVCLGGNYAFTVGANGVLSHSDGKRYDPKHKASSEASTQTYTFESNALTPANERGMGNVYTTIKEATEIGMNEKLLPGFVYPETIVKKDPYSLLDISLGRDASGFIKVDKPKDEDGYRIIVDIDHDPIFKRIVEYFKAEFATSFHNHSDKKLDRLALFAAYVADKSEYPPIMNQNFYLGDMLNSGKWSKRNNALLVKALADQLDIPCALVAERDGNRVTSWNVVDIETTCHSIVDGKPETSQESRRYVVDANEMTTFWFRDVPGRTKGMQGNLRNYYGIRYDY